MTPKNLFSSIYFDLLSKTAKDAQTIQYFKRIAKDSFCDSSRQRANDTIISQIDSLIYLGQLFCSRHVYFL